MPSPRASLTAAAVFLAAAGPAAAVPVTLTPGPFSADPGSAPATRETAVSLPAARAAGQKVADIPTLVKKLVDEAKAL